jgi:hypothetical protein
MMADGTESSAAAGGAAGSEALLAAVRHAIAERRKWTPPVVIIRYTDETPEGAEKASPYAALTQSDLTSGRWPGKGRQYETVAEFDAEELEDLEDYSEEDLRHYVATVLLW